MCVTYTDLIQLLQNCSGYAHKWANRGSTILGRPAAVSPLVGKDDGSRLSFPHN